MAEVYLHVGLPKTGTSTIQAALDERVEPLARAGVLYPGGCHRAHRLAAYDLFGQRVRGDDGDLVAGAFNTLMEEMARYSGRSIVVTEEKLGLARPRHVRKLVRRLGHHRLHVVIGVRDMARTVVSAWQQDVVTGGAVAWQDFIGAVRDPRQSAVPAALAFWMRHDVLRVIDTWSTAVPLDRIRLVTVPPRGASSRTLLARFAAATELPTGIWNAGELTERNVSLGAAEVELVRRLNPTVVGKLNQEQYRFVIERGIRPRLTTGAGRALSLPVEHLPWARQYGEALVRELQRRGVQVVGDLADLVPEDRPTSGEPFDVVSDAELLDAAQSALASLTLAHGALFRRYRRAFVEREGRLPSPQELVASRARAAEFDLRKAVLGHTTDSRALAWAARAYVERTSGRRSC